MYKSEEELLCDFRVCKKCKEDKHVFDMKIFLTGEVSKYCKGCYTLKPVHFHKVFNKNKYLRKYSYTKFGQDRAIKMLKNFNLRVKSHKS